MFGIDAIVALAGLLVPPAVDFVKKKWLKKEADTPEATMSTLATTKPDVLPEYVAATTAYLKAQIEYFNRDVCGAPAPWVVNLRAAIRPFGVAISFIILMIMVGCAITGQPFPVGNASTVDGVRYSCELIVSSWFGDRISITK